MFSSDINKFEPYFSCMSFNVRYDNPADGANSWEHRKRDVSLFMQKVRPSIFSLQEPLKHQLLDIKNFLSEYEFVGVGRTDGAEKGEYNPIFYKKDLFHLSENGTFWLSPTPEKPGSRFEEARIRRICTWGRFTWLKNKGDREFYLLNTHLDHENMTVREKQMKVILNFVEKILQHELPIILTGDFNAENGDACLKLLSSTGIFQETSIVADDCFTAKTFTGFHEKRGEVLDHIFVTGFHINLYAVLKDKRENQRLLSDHRPILCILEPQKK